MVYVDDAGLCDENIYIIGGGGDQKINPYVNNKKIRYIFIHREQIAEQSSKIKVSNRPFENLARFI